MPIMYHDGNRRFQDQFDSRRIADRLEQVTARTAFTDDDKTFIESRILFFLATADAEGRFAEKFATLDFHGSRECSPRSAVPPIYFTPPFHWPSVAMVRL